MPEEQAQPQGPQGPPGQEGPKPSEVLEAGGTNMQPEQVLFMAAELAWKEQNGQPLDEKEQAFVQNFFPEGLPPELAQFSPQAKQDFENVQGQMQPQPGAPAQQQAVGPPGFGG